jgi:hypothetical protein
MNLGEPVEDVVETLVWFKMKTPNPVNGMGGLTDYETKFIRFISNYSKNG